MLVDVALHHQQPTMLHAHLGRWRSIIGFCVERKGEDIHELLSELGSGVRVETGPLQGQRGTKFHGDPAKTAAEIEMRGQRRMLRVFKRLAKARRGSSIQNERNLVSQRNS